jgi:2-amino-4-hydroxy-6-hydroxymethyldihydropteridine diphosphokinase
LSLIQNKDKAFSKIARIFADVMNKALISIGTNVNREANLALCHKLLNGTFSEITYSNTSITTPYGNTYKDDFLNQLAFVYTSEAKEEVHKRLKSIEKKIGRNATDKVNGKVKIDIDLVIWNEEVLKPDDMERSYIVDLLPSLID